MHERATTVRDLLNKLVALENGSDIEAEIIRCALACAVEELEKFIYEGAMTPSVKSIVQPVPLSSNNPNAVNLGSAFVDLEHARALLIERERVYCLKDKQETAVTSIIQRTGCKISDAREAVANFMNRCVKLTSEEKTNLLLRYNNDSTSLGLKITTIKWIRERTDVGLKEAKDYVESHDILSI